MINAARFTVTIDDQGRITTQAEPADTINMLERTASTFDIYQACKEIVSDIDSHLLADRVSKLVLDKLQPKNAADEIKEKIISALNDRKQEPPLN